MSKPKYIEILEPNREFELPFKKDTVTGSYIVLPNHIGGKNGLRKLAASKVGVGYVYLVRIRNTQEYKIGVSTNPKRRLRDISSSMPYEIDILAVNKTNDPYVFEQELLDNYEGHLIRNEWFRFDIETAKEIMIRLHNKQVRYEAEKTK